MTIRQHINPSQLSTGLSKFSACVDNAPVGTYEQEKAIADILGETCDNFILSLRALGLKAPNCDAIREVEAVLYGYIAEANPLALAAAEGFGAALDTPARERVIQQTISNRDFLSNFRAN